MKVMILAAGRGQRMASLTDKTPKPLLHAGEHCLIERHLFRLAEQGFQDIVINLHYLPEQIREQLGNGEHYGLKLQYSVEHDQLETGGGIKQALPLLGDEPFLVLSADIVTDFPFDQLRHHGLGDNLGHVILVNNPSHHPDGDFYLERGAQITQTTQTGNRLTYGNIGLYHPRLFEQQPGTCFPLRSCLHAAIQTAQLSGEYYPGKWLNVDTPERLQLAKHAIEETPQSIQSTLP